MERRCFWICCYLLLSWSILPAQKSNQEVYDDWWAEFAATYDTLQEVKGFIPEGWKAPWVIDSTATIKLEIATIDVRYSKLSNGQYQRRLYQSFIIREGLSMKTDEHLYKDILNPKSVRRIVRQSPEALAGLDPTFRGSWLTPLSYISAGTGIIIGLFYIRSRSM